MNPFLLVLALIAPLAEASFGFSFENLATVLEDVENSWENLFHVPNEESIAVNTGKKSAEDQFDPVELHAPVISDLRMAQLEELYFPSHTVDFKKLIFRFGQYKRPQGKAEWLYFMQHYSEQWDTSNASKFKPEDIYNRKQMLKLSLKQPIDNRANVLRNVYLEGMCNVAIVDPEASKVFTGIIRSLKRARSIGIGACPACFPLCLFKRLRSRLSSVEIEKLLTEAIRNPFLTDEEVGSLVSEFKNLTKKGVIVAIRIFGIAFIESRLTIAQQISSIICRSVKQTAKTWTELKRFLNTIFSQFPVHSVQYGLLSSMVWSQQQVEIFEHFLAEFDELFEDSLQPFLPSLHKSHLEHPQTRQCISKYLVAPEETCLPDSSDESDSVFEFEGVLIMK